MVSNEITIDLERVRYFYDLRDARDPTFNTVVLAEEAHVNKGSISRWLNQPARRTASVPYFTYLGLAKALQIPKELLVFTPSVKWEILSPDPAVRNGFLADLLRCKSLLSISQFMDSYLLPTPMAMHVKKTELDAQHLPADLLATRMREFQEFVQVRRDGRHNHRNHLHHIAGTPDAFVQAFHADAALFDQVRSDMVAFKELTSVNFIRTTAWAAFYEELRRKLHFPSWTKINIADDHVVVVWCHDFIFFCTHKETVRDFREMIQSALGDPDLVHHETVFGHTINVGTMIEAYVHSSKFIDGFHPPLSGPHKRGHFGGKRTADHSK